MTTTKPDVHKVTRGSAVRITRPGEIGLSTFVVQRPHSQGALDFAGGQWVCITHDEFSLNNLSASLHEDDGREHTVGWWCWKHAAVEVP